MTDTPVQSQEQRQGALAPETHNDEQDDHLSQAQQVADDARALAGQTGSPTESIKRRNPGDDDSTQDLIDHMRDMERSGRIDMSAYRGEPNMDDEDGKYGDAAERDPDMAGGPAHDDGDDEEETGFGDDGLLVEDEDEDEDSYDDDPDSALPYEAR